MRKTFFTRRKTMGIFSIGFISLLLMLGYQNFLLPDFPSRNIDTKTVQKLDGIYMPTSNLLPLSDFSLDGRISLRFKATSKGPAIMLVKPEKVQKHFFSENNQLMGGGLIRSEGVDKVLDLVSAHKDSKIGDGMKAARNMICEKSEKIKNPSVCKNGMDCYEITIVSQYKKEISADLIRYRFVSMDIVLEIANPKTSSAYIANLIVDKASIKLGPLMDYPIIAEPTIAGDGRLLVTRVGGADVPLSDMKTIKKYINVVYSVYDQKSEQCDVTKWKVFHPISHAYYDASNKMASRYKFARYPLRDALGNVVSNGEEFGSSYPWIDKGAANLFFTTFGPNGFYSYDSKKGVVTPFEERSGSSVPGDKYFNLDSVKTASEFREKKAYLEEAGRTAGISVAGFWTHGKIVLLDGLLNNNDFLFRISDRLVGGKRINVHRDLKLYKNSGYETVGSVREIGTGVIKDEYHESLTLNSTFMSSIENRLNYNENIRPVTPRDVVWHFGTTRHQEELVFDDYNSMYTFINAEMTAPVEMSSLSKKSRFMRHLSGYEGGVPSAQVEGFPRKIASGYPALVQNTGTAPDDFMTLPYYGKIDTKYSRIEPIAKGGIHGKGLWLEEKGSLHFQVPVQQKNASFKISNNKNWYIGVFIDGRGKTTTNQISDFITFGTSSLLLKKVNAGNHLFDRILFAKNNKHMGQLILPQGLSPAAGRWMHLGVSVGNNGVPEVFLNGFSVGMPEPLSSYSSSDLKGFFSIKDKDNIYLGDNPKTTVSGIKGWFDDFKVMTRTPTYEESCNYARGTLVALSLNKNDSLGWNNRASYYPIAVHKKIANTIFDNNPNQRFACYVRYYDGQQIGTQMYSDGVAHAKNLPKNARSIREEVLGIKNMLVYDRPRPDFTKNQFCLSCHISSHPFEEMSLTALQKFPTQKMQDDGRRQPMQPPRYMRGHIPSGYFGAGVPARTIASISGSDVDQFMHPERSFIDIEWTSLGGKYIYSLDVRDSSSGVAKVYAPCANAGVIKGKNSYRLDAVCSSAGNKSFPMTHESEVRICYTKNGLWSGGNAKCSRYTPLNFHQNGKLNIFLEP